MDFFDLGIFTEEKKKQKTVLLFDDGPCGVKVFFHKQEAKLLIQYYKLLKSGNIKIDMRKSDMFCRFSDIFSRQLVHCESCDCHKKHVNYFTKIIEVCLEILVEFRTYSELMEEPLKRMIEINKEKKLIEKKINIIDESKKQKRIEQENIKKQEEDTIEKLKLLHVTNHKLDCYNGNNNNNNNNTGNPGTPPIKKEEL